VEIGDQISTGPNSRATITLSDGTQFELSDSTSMIVTQDQVGANGQRVQTRLDLFGGLLHSLVRFAPGNAPNYEVHTPNAVAAARGTQYDTDYVNGAPRKEHPGCSEFTDVSVFEGTVEVTNPKNKSAGSTTLTRGHKTTVPCGLLLGATAATTATTIGSTTAASTAAVSTTTIVAGAAVVGAGAIAGGVVAGVNLSGGGGGGSAPTPSPTPPVTPSG
jgi:ferric-dicitrate binding protein FerR (iron transport regulator)